MKFTSGLPDTLGALRTYKNFGTASVRRGVKDELRENLICKLQKREPLFPGVVGYEDHRRAADRERQFSRGTTSFSWAFAGRPRRGSSACW